MQTPLSQLMDMTKITAKQISNHTGINVTLLSKFKNRQRPLNYASRYPGLLAEYFLTNDREKDTQTVHRFLVSRNRSLADAPLHDLKKALAVWLSGQDEDEHTGTGDAVSSVFSDINDLKKSLALFTERVLSQEPGIIRVIHDFPDGETFYNSLLNVSLPFLTQMRSHGCSISVLDTCRMPKTYMTIHNWMDSYFSEQIRMYTADSLPGLRRMVFLSENGFALVVLGSGAGERAFLSTFYSSEETVEFFRKSAESSIVGASNMIERIPFSNIVEFLQVLDSALTNRGTTFLVNPVMMYKTMNLEILEKVLLENGIAEEDHPKSFETNRFTAYLRTKCPYRQIYNLDAMMEAASQEYYIDDELSALYGRPVRVSRQRLHEHIKFLTRLQAPDYQILFVPFKNMYLLHHTVSYVVQDDGIFLAWDNSRSQHRIYSRDTTVMHAAYNYMEEIWNSIPAELTAPEWQKEQIQKLLDLTSK